MTDKSTKNFIIQLKSVKVLGFEVTEAGNQLDHEIDSEGYEFKWAIKLDTIASERALEATLTTHLYEKAAPQKVELARLKVQFVIEVKNFEDFPTDPESKRVLLPTPLLPLIGGISVGTSRGIFLLCVLPTKFSNAVIPLIDPNIFLPAPSKEQTTAEKQVNG